MEETTKTPTSVESLPAGSLALLRSLPSWIIQREGAGIDDLYSQWVTHWLPKDQIKSVMELAVSVFEDRQIATEWLTEPNLATDSKPPITLLGTEEGFSRVQVLLHRIEHGVLA